MYAVVYLQQSKAGASSASSGITVLSEKQLFLGQKVLVLTILKSTALLRTVGQFL
jgi:SpoU rRNA methylase family enzyme